MTGALEIRKDQIEFDDKQLAALHQLGLDEVPDGDLLIFLHMCQKRGLDPFLRQIYLVGRQSQGRTVYTMQTGIDGFRLISERSGKYRGMTPTQWCGEDGIWRDAWLAGPKNPPKAARVGVLHADYTEPIYAVAVFDSYCPRYKDGNPMNLWATMPEVMIAKCAEALARRQAFPEDLSGIYTDDEMEQANNRELDADEPKDEKKSAKKEIEPPSAAVYTDEEMADVRVTLAEIDAATDETALKALYDNFPPLLREVKIGDECVRSATTRRLKELRTPETTTETTSDVAVETLPLA